MSSGIHVDNIENYLFGLTDLVTNANSINRSNRTVDAENLFCILLNQAFGWNLINANAEKSNQDSFDLVDKKRCLYIQVTSNKSYLKKFTSAVEKFKRKRLKNNTKFIVLFISRKVPQKILTRQKTGKLSYEGYDIPKLFKAIYYNRPSPQKLRAINELLEAELAPVRIGQTGATAATKQRKLPRPQLSDPQKGIYIRRPSLIQGLFDFGQIANGLLIGGPGAGKSFTIGELEKLCYRKKVPCVVIRINELTNASDKEIKQQIGITSANWISALKKITFSSQQKAFLVFDAFDTAKDEQIKSFIIAYLQRAIRELREKWTILVSARTFDASKSTRLVYKRDSLYELVDTFSKPAEYTTMIIDRMMEKVDDARFKQMKDSLDSIYAGRYAYAAKLIFTTRLFSRGKTKVKLSKTLNFQEDEIVLEQTWKENDKTCYLVRINNHFGKEQTSYVYAFNENMKFIWWEDCQLNRSRK